jgi:hypothetical protein
MRHENAEGRRPETGEERSSSIESEGFFESGLVQGRAIMVMKNGFPQIKKKENRFKNIIFTSLLSCHAAMVSFVKGLVFVQPGSRSSSAILPFDRGSTNNYISDMWRLL